MGASSALCNETVSNLGWHEALTEVEQRSCKEELFLWKCNSAGQRPTDTLKLLLEHRLYTEPFQF